MDGLDRLDELDKAGLRQQGGDFVFHFPSPDGLGSVITRLPHPIVRKIKKLRATGAPVPALYFEAGAALASDLRSRSRRSKAFW
jgi:hypothetical protein